MLVYLANLLLLAFWGLLIQPDSTNNRRKCYCVIAALQWGVLAGCRADSVGRDTAAYHTNYDSLLFREPSEVVNNFFQYLVGGPHFANDPGFYLYMKAFQLFGFDYRFFLMVTSLVISFSFTYFVYCNSKNVVLSYLLFSTVFFTFISFSAIRQSLALSLVTFLGYEFSKSHRLIPFALAIAVGFFFHRSALFAIPMYFVVRLVPNWKVFGATCALWLFLFVFSRPIVDVVLPMLGFGRYTLEYVGQRTWFYIVALGLVWVVSFLLRDRLRHVDERFDQHFMMLTMGFIIGAFALSNSNAFRLSYYYIFVVVLLIPDILLCLESRERTLCSVAFVIACVVFLVVATPAIMGTPLNPTGAYIPFWNY